jgi:hypothetical protein
MIAKRKGRPKKASKDRKDAKLIIRVSKGLWDAIDKARGDHDSPLSLSRECELRLRRTFDAGYGADKPDSFAALFATHPFAEGADRDGSKTYAFILAFKRWKESAEWATRKSWLEDRYTFDRVMEGLKLLWENWAPQGPPIPPQDAPLNNMDFIAPKIRGILSGIDSADEQPPMNTPGHTYSEGMRIDAAIKSRLRTPKRKVKK